MSRDDMGEQSAEKDVQAYWSELVPCTACPEGHDRMTFHSLGMVCVRCEKHTGNNNQGHYWGLCKVWLAQGKPWKHAIRELHFCCPGDCELEAATTPIPPRSSDAGDPSCR